MTRNFDDSCRASFIPSFQLPHWALSWNFLFLSPSWHKYLSSSAPPPPPLSQVTPSTCRVCPSSHFSFFPPSLPPSVSPYPQCPSPPCICTTQHTFHPPQLPRTHIQCTLSLSINSVIIKLTLLSFRLIVLGVRTHPVKAKNKYERVTTMCEYVCVCAHWRQEHTGVTKAIYYVESNEEKTHSLTGRTFLYASFTFSTTAPVYVRVCVCSGDSAVCSAQCLITSSHGAQG